MKKPMMTLTILVCAVALGLTACSNPAGGGGGPRPDQWDGSTATGFAGGSGEPGDPYIISTSSQLAYLAQQVSDGNTYAGEYFTLTGDLDFNDHEWIAIGTKETPFGGIFDGDGHVIHGLVITEGDDYQGLFGYLDGAVISNLGLEDVAIAIPGKDYVGGIAGYVTNSSIDNCYSTGTVSGTSQVGGIAGAVGSGGSVDNCYSTGEANGEDYVGGIAGQIDSGGSVADCYSTAEVSGTGSYAGGIAGAVESGGSVADCAALNPSVTAVSDAGRVAGSVESGGISDNNAAWEDMPGGSFSNDLDKDGTGITAEAVKDGTGFPFAVTDDPWTHNEGKLPILAGLEGQDDTLPVYITGEWNGNPSGGFAGGSGSIADPYRISTAAQLAYLAQEVNKGNTYAGKYFNLTRNLDLNGHDWTAIGTGAHNFSGIFDGQDNVISGLFIDKSGDDYQGLFGYLRGAAISNLGLEDVAITGKSYIGGIAGYAYDSDIDNCYSTGDVSGTSQVGGIAGQLHYNNSIENCYSTGDVSGTEYQVGGIAGTIGSGGSVDNCYSTGDISGTSQVGGIAGGVSLDSSIDNCYSTGDISGTIQVGGIAGRVGSGGSVDNCYSTGDISGTSQVGGIAGYTHSSNIDNCYSTGDISGTEYQVGGIAGTVTNDSSIDNCYSTGDISGTEYQVGGIAGRVSLDSSIVNCYSTGDISGTNQVGGIAGYVDSSSIENCAALNLTVTATSSAGRVVGNISSGALTGNVAWDGMTVTWGIVSNSSGKDGKGITTVQVQDGTGLPSSLKSDPWRTFIPGKLPTLKDLEGQDGTLPVHLE